MDNQPDIDPKLEGVRDQLAEVAEKAATLANTEVGHTSRLPAVRNYLSVTHAALRARALTDPDPYIDEDISVGIPVLDEGDN